MLKHDKGVGETGSVPEFCTCGAELPPDARFCHKCGKPQREEPQLSEPVENSLSGETPVDAEPLPALRPPVINLHNGLAVRVGFLAGSIAFVLGLLPAPFIGRVALLLFAGFLSVYFYRRRSGESLSIGNGARMGWISGLFCFVIITVLFTINMVMISIVSQEGGLAAFYRQQLGAMGMPAQSIEQVIEVFGSPLQITGLLFTLFVMFTGLLTAGGALGARLLRRD